MSKRLILLSAGLVSVALIAAGCGSSDDSTDTVSVDETITKQQLIVKGDEVCKRGNEEIEEGIKSYIEENDIPDGQEPNDEQGAEVVRTVIVPGIETQAEGIRELGIPEGDEEEIEAMLDSLDEAIEAAEEDPESLFEEGSDPFGEPNRAARDYGFKICGQS